MSPKTEERFEQIIQAAIGAMEAVKCPFADFVEGLEMAHESIKERLNGAREEAEGMGEG